MSDDWVYSSVELKFAVDEPVGMIFGDLLDDVVSLVGVGIFAARTVGGVGKESDFGLMASVDLKCLCGVFDDSV